MSGIMVIDIRHILLRNRFWGCWNVTQLFSHSPPLPSKRSFRSQPNYKSLFGVALPDILSYGGSLTDRILKKIPFILNTYLLTFVSNRFSHKLNLLFFFCACYHVVLYDPLFVIYLHSRCC